jgi:glutamate carboxypeptidase
MLDEITVRVPQIVDDLRRLVEVESPSHDHGAVALSANAVAELLEERLGVRPEVIIIDGCSHVRLRFGTPRVLILAHHDTVWPIGTLAEHPFSLVDGVIRGPGCFDMKSGLVQAVHALAALQGQVGVAALDGVSLLITGDEELGSPSSQALIEEEAIGCVASLVLEASGDGGALKIGRKGVSVYRVDIEGRAAHAGLEPEKGVNAGIELARQVLGIVDLGEPGLGTTVTPTTSTAGSTANTVPASARLHVDVRATSREEQQRVDDAMHAIRPHDGLARVVVHGGPNRPPMEHIHTRALFERASRLAAQNGLGTLRGVDVGGGSDGNFTAGLGVPTLDGLGAVGGGAHAETEHTLLDWLAPRTALLALLVQDLLAPGETPR